MMAAADKTKVTVCCCQLCDRHAGPELAFVCAACTGAAVYEARFRGVQCLLQREAAARDVERAVGDGDALVDGRLTTNATSKPTPQVSTATTTTTTATTNLDTGSNHDTASLDSAHRLAFDRLRSARAQTKLRSRAVYLAVQDTEAECRELRDRIARKKEDLQTRRDKLARDAVGLDRFSPRRDAIDLSAAKVASRSDVLARKTADARAFMVREAADLWGLTVKRKRQRDGRAREMAYLAGLPAPDLRELLQAKPEQLNASLVAVAYLLNQTCAYLGLQMPSQLLLPDKDCAWPRILPVHSSYSEPGIQDVETPTNPGLAGSQSQDMRGSMSGGGNRADGGPHSSSSSSSEARSRARPLYLRRPLMKLFSEDAVTYESFVEAMSLLAFDIAWLAKTQGIDVCQGRRGTWSWEGACDLGRNLWLLYRPVSSSSTTATAATATRKPEVVEGGSTGNSGGGGGGGGGDGVTKDREGDDSSVPIRLGTFSHGTSRNNAAGPGSSAALGLADWRLANPNYLIRKVKDALADRKMAGEWELLEEDEWGGGDGGDGTAQEQQQQQEVAHATDPDRQTKGWQKLRPRNQDG